MLFLKKESGKVGTLRRFCSFFPSEPRTFRHIFYVNLDRKYVRVTDIFIFTMENGTAFIFFLLNHPIYRKTELNRVFMSILDKNDEKMAREKTLD